MGIASSAKVHPTSVHICGVVVEYQTPTGRGNKGVATTWLQNKVPTGEGEDMVYPKVPVYVRRSQFRLPNRPQTPVIMIGPGTGLAPFRGFIQERAWQKSQGKPVGPTVLYFGCRNKSQDYIYQDELEDYEKDGLLTLHTAFSRDQKEKRYVTHCLRETGAAVWDLLDSGAHLYVCGDARMIGKYDLHRCMNIHFIFCKNLLCRNTRTLSVHFSQKLRRSEADWFLYQKTSLI